MSESLFDPASSLVGQTIDGRYELIERLGGGGMGRVYKARRVGVGRTVAVKFLRAAFANRDEFVKRFEREVVTMGRLYHPNCVSLVDFGFSGGAPYLVMEYVEGKTLAETIGGRPMQPRRALGIIQQLLSAVGYLHRRNVIHRDLKADNVMLVTSINTDFVKLLDLGMAKLLAGLGADDLTMHDGLVVGTPSAMSPEQIRRLPLDERTDIYSSGLLLYHLLVGRKPFFGDTGETIDDQLDADPQPLRDVLGQRAISEELEGVVLKSLAKDRDDRYSSVEEMSGALAATPEGRGQSAVSRTTAAPPHERRSLLVFALVGWLAAALFAGLWLGWIP